MLVVVLGALPARSQPEVGFDMAYLHPNPWWQDGLIALALAIVAVITWRVVRACARSKWFSSHPRLVCLGWPTLMLGLGWLVAMSPYPDSCSDHWSIVPNILVCGFFLVNIPVGLALGLVAWFARAVVGLNPVPVWIFVPMFWVIWYITIRYLQARDWSKKPTSLSIIAAKPPSA
jgi:ABC-type Fe3+ transport system permease subunit